MILNLIFIKLNRDFTRYKSVVLPVVKRKMITIRRPRDIESRLKEKLKVSQKSDLLSSILQNNFHQLR